MDKNPDIIDAEFVTVVSDQPTPSEKPVARKTGSGSAPADKDQLDVFRSSGTAKQQSAQRRPQGGEREGPKPMPLPLFAFVAVFSSCAAFLLAGGYTLVPHLNGERARSAPVQVHEDLTLHTLDLTPTQARGRNVLTVKARIKNNGRELARIPPVLVELSRSRNTPIFRIKRGEMLEPGQQLAFTTHIPVGNHRSDEIALKFVK